MLVQHDYPSSMPRKKLDRFLSRGWFRNANMMYRSRLICLKDNLYSVVNIRLPLEDYVPSKSLRKIIRKNDERFRVVIQRIQINTEKEALYKLHKERFEGFIYNTLELFFHGEEYAEGIFETYELCVYDEGQLVAVSFFDLGEQGMASLLGIFDPNYRKFSFGTYTMLKELEYAQQLKLKHYYPGYVLDAAPIFDYKLRLGDFQYYNWTTKRWRKWQPRTEMDLDAPKLWKRMQQLLRILQAEGIDAYLWVYPLFSVGYLAGGFVNSPLFISCFQHEPFEYMVEYSVDEGKYYLSEVSKMELLGFSHIMESRSVFDWDNVFEGLLEYEYILEIDADVHYIVSAIRDLQFTKEVED